MRATPRMICISGPDGVGKTTQASRLVADLRKSGIPATYRWLRFSHIVSLPVLLYLRVAGRSKTHVTACGRRMGTHDLRDARVARVAYALSMLIDMTIVSIYKIRLPLMFGNVVIVDRYVLDAVVDISLSSGMMSFHKSILGKTFFRLVPRDSKCVILTSEKDLVLQRRPECSADEFLDERLQLYLDIAAHRGYPVIRVGGLSADCVYNTLKPFVKLEWPVGGVE